MPTFKYSAKDASSRNVVGKIVTENKQSVIEELRKRNLTIISIDKVKEASLSKSSFQRKRVKPEDLVIFTRMLATMIEAGIPILQALDALQEQISHVYFRGILISIRDDIESGSSLSASFAKYPAAFDTLFVNMVKVGETGGVLNSILERVSSYLEKTLKLKRKVKAALIYPSLIVFMAITITIGLLVKVVPKFAGIYDSFDAELPAMTQMLISISNILKNYLLFVLGGIIFLGFVVSRWYCTNAGRRVVDSFILKIPVFGSLIRKVAISRFSRTLSTLLQSGVPILESLDIVGKTSGNRVIELVIDNVKIAVREGDSVSVPLIKSGVFPPMVTRMIAIGEKSGQLEKMLTKIADFYDDQVDAAVAGLTSIIEPLIIGLLGIIIGFIVIALFLPIINITQIL